MVKYQKIDLKGLSLKEFGKAVKEELNRMKGVQKMNLMDLIDQMIYDYTAHNGTVPNLLILSKDHYKELHQQILKNILPLGEETRLRINSYHHSAGKLTVIEGIFNSTSPTQSPVVGLIP